MKRFLFACFLIHLVGNISFTATAQEAVSEKLSSLDFELSALKDRIRDNAVDTLYQTIEGLRNQLFSLENMSTQASKEQAAFLTEQIKKVEGDLTAKESVMEELQENFNQVNEQIINIVNTISQQSTARAEAERLAFKASQAQNQLSERTIGKFIGDVRTWRDLGAVLDAISTTAGNLLIFPEPSSTQNMWVDIGKNVGLVGAGAGSFMSISGSNKTVGLEVAAISLTITGLLQTIFKNNGSAEVIENIARNRAFTDEVMAFNRISDPFKVKAQDLYKNIYPYVDKQSWRPSKENLKNYYVLISLRRDLTVVVRQMKAKAQHLLSFNNLTPKGRDRLEEVIAKYDSALSSWESSESVYLATYNYLNNKVMNR